VVVTGGACQCKLMRSVCDCSASRQKGLDEKTKSALFGALSAQLIFGIT
jgi:hypothetical protein